MGGLSFRGDRDRHPLRPLYGQNSVATKSIQFDLRKIGESLYEVLSKSGKWPAEIADLEGTEYLKMPHRKALLENGLFEIVWQHDLDPIPRSTEIEFLRTTTAACSPGSGAF